MLELGLKVVLVDVWSQFDLLDGDARLFLTGIASLLIGFKAVLTPVHHLDDDGTGVRSDLDEIESRYGGSLFCLIEWNDTDLFACGSDQSDGRESNLVVDTDIVFDADKPPGSLMKSTLVDERCVHHQEWRAVSSPAG